MKIVYGVNSDYLLPALVSIWSIYKHTHRSVEIVIYGQDFNQRDYDLIDQFKEKKGSINDGTITVKSFDISIFEGYAPPPHKKQHVIRGSHFCH